MSSLEEMMDGMFGPRPEEAKKTPLDPAVVRVRIEEAAERFARPRGFFKAGDWVTSVADSPYNGAGEPHLVIESDSEAKAVFNDEDLITFKFGLVQDIKILCLADGSSGKEKLVAFWTCSDYYVPYLWGETE